MRRIGLAVVLTLSLTLGSLAADAQPQPDKLWRIGVLMSLYQPDADPPRALRQGLRTLGYVEGQNLFIEWRYAQGRDDRLPALAAELVRLKVDLIVADITIGVRAAMQATSGIPIVMAVSADTVGGGLVSSLARPGGNVTGLSILLAETSVKRLQLLKEAVPKVSRVALLGSGIHTTGKRLSFSRSRRCRASRRSVLVFRTTIARILAASPTRSVWPRRCRRAWNHKE